MSTPNFEEEAASDFEEIGENVLIELSRRLRSPALREGLPGTLLMKLAENYLKYKERQEIQSTGKEEAKLGGLEIIDQPGLSLEKKKEIMGEYIQDLETEWRAASEKMAEIVKELASDPAPVS